MRNERSCDSDSWAERRHGSLDEAEKIINGLIIEPIANAVGDGDHVDPNIALGLVSGGQVTIRSNSLRCRVILASGPLVRERRMERDVGDGRVSRQES